MESLGAWNYQVSYVETISNSLEGMERIQNDGDLRASDKDEDPKQCNWCSNDEMSGWSERRCVANRYCSQMTTNSNDGDDSL